MLSEVKKRDLEKQGYRVIGTHSAIKVCMWTKRAIKNQGTCYKHKFYGIKSWRCVQMTPALGFCTQRCQWCWRDIDFTLPGWTGKPNDPDFIIKNCIKEQIRYLSGFGGNPRINKERYKEALKPKHFAISLAGEPTLYPLLPLLINRINKNMTTFLVTNGTNPDMLKKLLKSQPTQLYLTLPAPDQTTYIKTCAPLIKDGWDRILKSLKLISRFNRSVIRLTLVRGLNMVKAEGYARLVEESRPDFIEVKAYMWVGYSRERLSVNEMPLHSEIKKFAEMICKNSSYFIADESPISRVVLLMNKDSTNRKIENVD